MKTEKNVYDVIYVSNKDLGINVDKNDRPAIIVDIKDNGDGSVFIFTSKFNPRIKQIRVSNGSFINLDKKYKLSKNILDYSDFNIDINISMEILEKLEKQI